MGVQIMSSFEKAGSPNNAGQVASTVTVLSAGDYLINGRLINDCTDDGTWNFGKLFSMIDVT